MTRPGEDEAVAAVMARAFPRDEAEGAVAAAYPVIAAAVTRQPITDATEVRFHLDDLWQRLGEMSQRAKRAEEAVEAVEALCDEAEAAWLAGENISTAHTGYPPPLPVSAVRRALLPRLAELFAEPDIWNG